jgi:hypothetical protein
MMATDLAGPGVTATNALTAVAGVLPAIEQDILRLGFPQVGGGNPAQVWGNRRGE